MERKEQIRQRSMHEVTENRWAFVQGAEWADEHPSVETVEKCIKFFNDYKQGAFGFVTLAEAVEHYFND